MWGAQSHGVSAKNWLRRTLQKNVERRALSDLRDDLLDIATEIAYLDPSMTHVVTPDWWNPGNCRRGTACDHPPRGLGRGAAQLKNAIEYIEKRDEEGRGGRLPVIRQWPLKVLLHAIEHRCATKPYLSYKEYLGCMTDLVVYELRHDLGRAGPTLYRSVWSRSWTAFASAKKKILDRYPARTGTTWVLALHNAFEPIDEATWSCNAPEAVDARIDILQCMAELTLPNWPSIGTQQEVEILPGRWVRPRTHPTLTALQTAIRRLKDLASHSKSTRRASLSHFMPACRQTGQILSL
ncbi:hypothetical protein JCM3766R1_006231 [Sporobolomyces carnicolor]